jgi:hypothetical protein
MYFTVSLELRCNGRALKIEKCLLCGSSHLLRSETQVHKMSALKKGRLCSSTCLISETTQWLRRNLVL